MSKLKNIVWIVFGLIMLVNLGVSYLIDKNQNDYLFLMKMKNYIPFMFYFSITGVTLFILSFMISKISLIKAKKQINQLGNDKNQLKAKLFDIQEAAQSKSAEIELIAPAPESETEEPTKPEEETN